MTVLVPRGKAVGKSLTYSNLTYYVEIISVSVQIVIGLKPVLIRRERKVFKYKMLSTLTSLWYQPILMVFIF